MVVFNIPSPLSTSSSPYHDYGIGMAVSVVHVVRGRIRVDVCAGCVCVCVHMFVCSTSRMYAIMFNIGYYDFDLS